jgi:chromosome segregation protein
LFLKSIELHGFKTFAQKTHLTFKPGVTAIVGPNGCGKSNIVDAIRWVLGETSARSLRGDVMEDVIFSGSDEAKPLGMAEVSITIVNDDNLLPVEYSEVTVKRRFYRSGESEFFINNNDVRLRDIHDLFADTGIGKPAYSIMEQGNIDMILSNKPEERMLVFEEAAGITRYKMRIKDSYRKLSATEENLTRLGLVISEVEKEYHHLEKQAEMALLYRSLKKEERDIEAHYTRRRIDDLEKQRAESEENLGRFTEKRTALEEKIGGINDDIRRKLDEMREIERENTSIQSEIYKRDADIETIGSKSSHIAERIEELEATLRKREEAIERSNQRKRELKEKREAAESEIAQIVTLIDSQQEKITSYEREIGHVDESIERASRRVSENGEKTAAIEKELEDRRVELKEITDLLVREIDSIRADFSGDEERKNRLLSDVNETIRKVESLLKHHGDRLADVSLSERGGDHFQGLIADLIEESKALQGMVARLARDVQSVLSIQDALSGLLFGKESIHTRKTEVEGTIDALMEESGRLKEHTERLREEIRKNRVKKENYEEIINGIRPDVARNRERKLHLEETLRNLKADLEKSDDELQDIEIEIRVLEEKKRNFRGDIEKSSQTLRKIEDEKKNLSGRAIRNNGRIDALLALVEKLEGRVATTQESLQKVRKSVEKTDVRIAEINSRIETIRETFRERYGLSPDGQDRAELLDMERIVEKRNELRNRLSELGQVNLIAIEEFQEVKKRYQYLVDQRDDLDKARSDLHRIVADTMTTSHEIFMDTFGRIGKNFNSIFRRLFNGGRTELYLTNDGNIFEAGVEIMACPPGKTLKKRNLLSGGEKSLTAAALLFSIFMVRPSPFCMLDEVDHDLDEENVLRFLKLLKEFTDTTQFVIITHNRRTIEFSDVIYGVTSEQAGVSKMVSLDMVENAAR